MTVRVSNAVWDEAKTKLTFEVEAGFATTMDQWAFIAAVKDRIAEAMAREYLLAHHHELMLHMDLKELSALVLAQVIANTAEKFAGRKYS